MIQLETSIDDMSPEYLGESFQQGLLAAGAIDYSISQQLMKKGRYGFLLSLLLKEKDLEAVSNYLFDNTSTIGLRYHKIDRIELPREILTEKTPFGEIRFKASTTPTDFIKAKPEFEDVEKAAAAAKETPFQIQHKLNNYPTQTSQNKNS